MATTSSEQLAKARSVARQRDPHAGHQRQDRQVPHAVVTRSVVAGDASPVEHERDRQAVQADVHQNLVERPVQERGVDAEHRVQATHGHARGRRHRVLLGDADVDDAIRVGLRERGRARPGATSRR